MLVHRFRRTTSIGAALVTLFVFTWVLIARLMDPSVNIGIVFFKYA